MGHADASACKQRADPARAVLRRHPLLLRSLAIGALLWGVGYLTWRIGWSGDGGQPGRLRNAAGDRGLRALGTGTLAWFSWSRPPAVRPAATPGRSVDVYVCTYDEPTEVVSATLAGCRALTYPHTTYLLDDGRRPEMEELAKLAGARYLTRPDNSHAKAGNINAALERTVGELVLMLDADHVPMPDALDAMVGYHDEVLVQGLAPHDLDSYLLQRDRWARGNLAVFTLPESPCAVLVGAGTVLRLLDLAGVGPLHDLPGIAR